jgi:hypothetical protein
MSTVSLRGGVLAVYGPLFCGLTWWICCAEVKAGQFLNACGVLEHLHVRSVLHLVDRMHAPGVVDQYEFIQIGLNLLDDRVTLLSLLTVEVLVKRCDQAA